MKRFYKVVTAVEQPEGWHIHLDGRPIKTPAKNILTVPAAAIANAIVLEWEAQVDRILPETMPMTQISSTALDHVADQRAEIEHHVLAYLNTDLLLYRTVLPEAVATLQAVTWDPWVKWFADQSGARLSTTTDLLALKQPDQAHVYARETVQAMDLWLFNIVQLTTAISGSVVLALAFAKGAASVDDVFRASQLEELYRAEFYNESLHGPDPSQEKKQASMRRDLNAMAIILQSRG